MNKLYNFMYGRYGFDDLYKFNSILVFIILLINIFVDSKILSIVSLVLIMITFYRAFSKQVYKRRKENDLFLKYKVLFLKPFLNIKRNMSDNENIYKRCHCCHKTLKMSLPSTRGIKHVKCPSCKKRNTFLVLRKFKVEIIKSK